MERRDHAGRGDRIHGRIRHRWQQRMDGCRKYWVLLRSTLITSDEKEGTMPEERIEFMEEVVTHGNKSWTATRDFSFFYGSEAGIFKGDRDFHRQLHRMRYRFSENSTRQIRKIQEISTTACANSHGSICIIESPCSQRFTFYPLPFPNGAPVQPSRNTSYLYP